MQQRLHANNRRHDPAVLLRDVWDGVAVSTPATLGRAAAIWVRDEPTRREAEQRWNDLPVRVLGELHIVSG